MFRTFLRISSPPVFYKFATKVAVPLWFTGLVFFLIGTIYAIFFTPVDAQQGEVYRVLYVHVPSAWLSMFIYVVAFFYATIYWVWRTDVSAVMLRASLPTGALMTVVALVTGSLWGKPTWGTYWVWDARLTTELVLLFIYLGLIAVGNLIEDSSKTDKALALITLFGFVNIPLIYFSVIFFNTLHQGFSLGATNAEMAFEIKLALFICTIGAWFLCSGNILLRAKTLLIDREADSLWLKSTS